VAAIDFMQQACYSALRPAIVCGQRSSACIAGTALIFSILGPCSRPEGFSHTARGNSNRNESSLGGRVKVRVEGTSKSAGHR
jgi:hypothetical protein